MAGCPRSSTEFEVPQIEHQRLYVVGICHVYCSKEREYTNLNAVVNIYLMSSQHPVSTSFQQFPKFYLGIHAVPRKLTPSKYLVP